MHLKLPISLLCALLSFYNFSSALPFLKWRRTPTVSNVPRATYSIVPIDGSGGEGDGSDSDDEPPATVIETQTVVSTHTPTKTVIEVSPPVTSTITVSANPTTFTHVVPTTISVIDQHTRDYILCSAHDILCSGYDTLYPAINPSQHRITIDTDEPNKHATSFINPIYLDDFVLREPDDYSSGDHHHGAGAGAALHKLNSDD
ncbi:hypothetical protein DL768_000890 [Monosporascus sp. mg162]|nr:hypothetical protein DL768_000890 [Monosporascus sp. mg162]